MIRPLTALALLAAHAALAQSPPRVGSLEWMSGTWVQETPQEKVSESWLGPANGLMVAANLTARANGRKSFEFLRIAETPEGFSYYASPGGKAPVEFRLKDLSERRVVFENAAHDFPQRVIYWREGEALVARIEGTIGGKDRHEQWRFSRAR
jgi:hypothetical protein